MQKKKKFCEDHSNPPRILSIQCPMRAFYHFYLFFRIKDIKPTQVCQCPMRAFHHFYADFLVLCGSIPCVSMPYAGFSSFLRYPFKNGLFMPFFSGVFAGIFQNILINVVSDICFLPCSYFVYKFCPGLNLMNLHSFQNPGSPAIFVCIFSPKPPDKSSSRLPAVETAHMRSAGLHADRCLSIFPLPILQRIPEHDNTTLSFAVFFRTPFKVHSSLPLPAALSFSSCSLSVSFQILLPAFPPGLSVSFLQLPFPGP